MTGKATRGRPPWQPTERERGNVESMAARGIPEKRIAAVIGALAKHCRTKN